MANDNKLLCEEETCKTDNSAPIYTIRPILHIQILLHTVQLGPAEAFLASHLEPFRAVQPEPFLAVHLEPKTQNPKPSRAV